jgi:hypothetical protein
VTRLHRPDAAQLRPLEVARRSRPEVARMAAAARGRVRREARRRMLVCEGAACGRVDPVGGG